MSYYLKLKIFSFRTDSLPFTIRWGVGPRASRAHTPFNSGWKWVNMEAEKFWVQITFLLWDIYFMHCFNIIPTKLRLRDKGVDPIRG